MRHVTFTAVALMIATTASAQQTVNLNLDVTATGKIPTANIAKGNGFYIKSVKCDARSSRGYNYLLDIISPNGESMTLDLSRINIMPISFNAENKDDYWYARTIRYSLPSLASMNDAYSLRTKAENSANLFIVNVRDNALSIEDPYLTSYINSLLAKINPTHRLDFFNYNFKAVVLKDDDPNACIYPNGTLVINAGLLARIHTEDELVAILCHEANHFICNHYLNNMSKIQKRQAAGTIGSAVLGTVAGILTKSASIGLSTASLSMNAANDINAIITSMGLSFDQAQETESDQAAIELLPILGYDRNGMATCLRAIGDYYLNEGNLSAYYASGNHPRIEDRILNTGSPYHRSDSEFEKKMAPCVSFVAQVLYAKGRYSQAMELIEQNIGNNAGRGIDYYLRGECLLASSDSGESNEVARESLLKARETFPDGLPTLKALIVADIRLGKTDEAKELIREFKNLAKDSEEDRMWAESMLQNLSF